MSKTHKEMLHAFKVKKKQVKTKCQSNLNYEACLLAMCASLGDPPDSLEEASFEFRNGFVLLAKLNPNIHSFLMSKNVNKLCELEEIGFSLYCEYYHLGYEGSSIDLSNPVVGKFLERIKIKSDIQLK